MWTFFKRRRETKEQRLLDLLQTHGEMSGYDIHVATEWNVGGMYVMLDRMEKDGRLISRWGVATAVRGWRRPRLYRLNQTVS